MRLQRWTCLLALALAIPAWGQAADRSLPPAAPPAERKPIVQIAILLDTSNSMDGLIAQTKTQLWKIVNEFARGERAGKHPDIQVALYQYGTPSLGVENGYIKQLAPLTDDLDHISDLLFKLTTDGGDEYCGAVIKKAVDELKWSDAKDAYKAIFIAGNEPFTQGTVDFHGSCKEAISKGILVNTIFCGPEKEGIDTHWKDGALLADGAYMSINQDAAPVAITAPQDKEIAELGGKINTTYLRYGVHGEQGAANQHAQDLNAATAPSAAAAVERSITKSGVAYRNSSWDLVDAAKNQSVNLKDIKTEDLPQEMQKLDEKGRADYVAKKDAERTQIQSRIQQLSTDRDKYLAEKRKDATTGNTLDTAVLKTVHEQAKQSGMEFPEGK